MSTLSKWLQPPSKDSLEQQYQELANLLRTKEKALETTSHDLKVKTAAMQILEQKIMSSETMITSTQRELTARTEQMKVTETELAVRSNRVTALEAEADVARQRMNDLNLIISDQAEEVRRAQQARQAAEQAQEVLKEEIRVLREHIVQLNEGLTDRNYLRAQVEKMESSQDRVHQLEVELSDREAAHRGTIQQLERALAERDQRIHAFDASAAAQADEVQGAQQACRAAEQVQEVLKEEIRVLREHIAQLNEGLPARERLLAEAKEQVKELESMRSRVHQLEVELSDREAAHRGALQQLERALTERDQRIHAFDASAAAQADEVHGAQQACRAAEQVQEVLKEEIRVLREHIAQLNQGLADHDRLRAQVAKLDSTQDRVHQLEVELSDREAAHRDTLQQLERSLAERDKRIEKLMPVTHVLREKESEIKEWENKFTRTVRDHERHVTKLQEQCAAQDQLREQHRLAERHLHERDEQIASLQHRLHDLESARQQLTTEVQRIPEKDEQISRLRKRLREMQAELRAEAIPSAKGSTIATGKPVAKTAPPAPSTKAAQPTVGPHQGRQNGAGHHSYVDQAKSSVTPNTKAGPINKAVPNAKAAPDTKAAPGTKTAPSTNAAPTSIVPRQGRQNGAGKNSHVAQPKSGSGKDIQKDDLQKINGIGPVFAQTLNKLGTYTFIQIARWKPADIEKVSKRLETDPERIRRENWIADAKKQHYKKYGERL
ncbi:MAG: hypothetical protein KF693_07785 [Nitrospira sp.]|nr:hypothetical protein [Nitrospira sp.]